MVGKRKQDPLLTLLEPKSERTVRVSQGEVGHVPSEATWEKHEGVVIGIIFSP